MTTVLVVDDDEDARDTFTDLLTKTRYESLAVGDGSQCIDLLSANVPVDLILLDLQMPVLDGMATLKKIRAANAPYKHLPIIILTGYADEKKVAKTLVLGATDYLVKPVSLALLDERLQKAVRPTVSEEELRMLLRQTRAPDPSILPQLTLDQDRDLYRSFIVKIGNGQWALALHESVLPSRLATMAITELMGKCQVFKKAGDAWQYMWPTHRQYCTATTP